MSNPTSAAALSWEGAPQPRLVVYDSDMDFDDASALAVLAEEHKRGSIVLRAVTVTNNGAGYPGKAYRHAVCLLEQLGVSGVPVADATYDLPNVFPEQLRAAVDLWLDASIAECPAGNVPAAKPAGELLADVLTAAPGRITLVATGPLSNIGAAFTIARQRRGWPAALLVRNAFVMGGAFDAPVDGTLLPPEFDGTQEINIWGDPAAAQTVIEGLAPLQLRMVALDATQFVPVRLAYVDQLTAEARSPAAMFVASVMNQPLLYGAIGAGLPVYWWDPLAALSALEAPRQRLVQYRLRRIAVVQDGPSQGRTVVTPEGAPTLVGIAAAGPLFESSFLAALNGQ